jgi:limonene-1,2-epoxide hydrolase
MNGPIAATGKSIEIRACAVIEMSGERARAERHYFDMATMLRQIGVNG